MAQCFTTTCLSPQPRTEETAGGHGHQACYDELGVIILNGISAGSADKAATSKINLIKAAKHRDADVLPFIWAAQMDGNPVKGIDVNRKLNGPIMHEGFFLDAYLRARPSNPNQAALLTPRATP